MTLTYSQQLKHPNWQKKRLEILDVDNWKCTECGNSEETLHVHHKQYIKGRMAWEYSYGELVTLCESCHEDEHYISDELKKLLAQVNILKATSVLKGFHAKSDWFDPDIADCGRDRDPHTFACGFLAFICQGLSIEQVAEVANHAAALQHKDSEYRLHHDFNRWIFGEENAK